jgi:hypothetical protein
MLSIRALLARSTRKLSIIAMAMAGYTVSACSPERALAPAAVDASASQSLVPSLVGQLGSLLTVKGLTWKAPVAGATATAVIGRNGGTVSLGEATLTIPAGAVTSNTTFQIIRVPGNIVAYDFEPHGTAFPKPLTLSIKTGNTTLATYANPRVRGAYFPLAALLDQVLGLGRVSEFREATLSNDRSKVTFTVEHFSGYMVSMD